MVKIKTGNRTNNGCQNHTENYTLKKKKKPKQNKRGSGIIRVYPFGIFKLFLNDTTIWKTT
jgi:hypothetical protein